MKLQCCREGRHGACDYEETVSNFDEASGLIFVSKEWCECWCHIVPIPEPDPGEHLYDASE